jgi:hypothetical protein
MPIVGRKPKPEDQRRNPNPPRHDWIEVMNVPYAGPVPNPGRLPGRTKRWWAVVSRMAHCALWDAGDWEYAVDTAQVHAEWVRTGQSSFAVEVRQREKKLGLTWDSRRDLRIRYVEAAAVEEAPEGVTALDEYRMRLGS